MAETALLAEVNVDLATIVSVLVGAFVTIYTLKLNKTMTAVKETGELNHVLLNSGKLEMQRLLAISTAFKAMTTKDPVDIAAATQAELDYQAHKIEADKMAKESAAKAK